MKNRKVLIVLAVLFVLSVLCGTFVACDNTKQFTVTFDAQNGTEPQAVTFDESFALPENPTKDGFLFEGWYTDSVCSDGKEWIKPESLDADLTVYAKWVEALFVTFDAQNGSESQSVRFDENFVMPADPENNGYTFAGWYTDAACTTGNEWTKPETLTESITVYAKWKKAMQYSVYFDPQNGENIIVLRFDENFVMPADPEKQDYAFCGWYTDRACTEGNEWTKPETLNVNLTVYAKWEKDTFYVTFDTQDGSKTQSFVLNSSFVMPTDPEREDYAFGGWYTDSACTDGSEWTNPETPTDDVTVYAKWVQVAFYINFDFQNKQDPVPVRFDEEFQIPVLEKYDGNNFLGWYTDKGCTDGNEWTKPETLTEDTTVYAKWSTHEHVYDDSYFMYTQCKVEGCSSYNRSASLNTDKEKFVYTFSDADKERINAAYQAVVDNLGKIPEAEFEDLFLAYDSELSYIVTQYQVSNVLYSVYNNEEYSKRFENVANFYNEHVSKYYGLFRSVYDSEYRDEFFAGWPEEEIKQVLAIADSYGKDEYIEINNQIDALLLEYNSIVATASATKLTSLYKELVELNNQLAELSGYDNYMDYAYEVVYERDYTPADVAEMRQYVKKYIRPILNKLLISTPSSVYLDGTIVQALVDASVFPQKDIVQDPEISKLATDIVGSYLKELYSDKYANTIDYFYYAEELFKNGNYYIGSKSGAFTYWIPSLDKAVLYFSDTNESGSYSYQNAFTFLHEFGHYYNGIYNHGLSLSMDHDETQSQGDEMLFLAWLGQEANNYLYNGNGYTYLWKNQLVDILFTICASTAVDEFEQAVYTDNYKGQSVKDNYSNYQDLFEEIIAEYNRYINPVYWSYVVFENAGYYISYAMSALPSVEIYVKGMEDFASAKESYFMLYTFADDTTGTYVSIDEYGNKEVIATYQEILNYCGLQGPFQEELYTTLYEYFVG